MKRTANIARRGVFWLDLTLTTTSFMQLDPDLYNHESARWKSRYVDGEQLIVKRENVDVLTLTETRERVRELSCRKGETGKPVPPPDCYHDPRLGPCIEAVFEASSNVDD